jgi:hypothetical protein
MFRQIPSSPRSWLASLVTVALVACGGSDPEAPTAPIQMAPVTTRDAQSEAEKVTKPGPADPRPAPAAAPRCERGAPELGLTCVVCADAEGPLSKDCSGGERATGEVVCSDGAEGTLTCRTCKDAAGTIVSKECARPAASRPAPVCRRGEPEAGLSCVVCTDAEGVASKDCAASDRPRGPLSCGDAREGGLVCRSCKDGAGVVVSKECARPTMAPPGAPVCRSGEPDSGLACTVCADAEGPLSKDCPAKDESRRPATCTSGAEGKLTCRICADAAGGVLSKLCARPQAGGEPPKAGAPTSGLPADCREQEESGLACVVCTDGSGAPREKACARRTPPADRGTCQAEIEGAWRCRICRDADGATISKSCAAPPPAAAK